jgi:hypothetical protein
MNAFVKVIRRYTSHLEKPARAMLNTVNEAT